jgi:aryl-alcohol dehydrogenase-like predicted oxidoreductase
MQTRPLPHANRSISLITLGTMTWGQQNTPEQAFEQLDWALDNGINAIDTAEMYPVPPNQQTYSHTEQIIGRWIKQAGAAKRNQLLLASKVAGPGRDREWIRGGDSALSAKNIVWACEDSLRRLNTDYLDLFQIHWPDRNVAAFGNWQFNPALERPTVPLLEQMQAMADLIKAGKIRAWGVSNETSWGLTRFAGLAEQHNLPKPASIQNAYHLMNRLFEGDLAEVSFREQIPLLAYSPLAMGMLTGKYDHGAEPAGARVTLFKAVFGQRYTRPLAYEAAAAYNKLARDNGLSPIGLALSFIASKPFVGSIIVGATSVAQLQQQVQALDQTDINALIPEIEKIALRFSHPAA